MPKFCENCGAPIPKPEQRFCPQCGAPIAQHEPPPGPPPKVCRACGTPIKPGEVFCSKCLVRVPSDEPPQTNAAPVPAKSPVITQISSPSDSTSPATKVCRACGTPIKPGEVFCSKCLVRVPSDEPPQTNAVPVPAKSPVITQISSPSDSTSPAAKVCRACGTPIKPGEVFCSKCLVRVPSDEPPQTNAAPAPAKSPVIIPVSPPLDLTGPAAKVCRACGTPIKPGEVFCGKCLVRVPSDEPPQTNAPPVPAKSPVIPPASPPPAPISPAPASSAPQKGGTSFKKIAIGGILALIILVGVVVLFSEDDTGQVASSFAGSGNQLPWEAHDISGQSISAQDIQQRNQALTGLAAALDKGDEQAVLDGMSAGSREKYGTAGLGLSSEESAILSAALRNARPITEYPHSTMYETSINGKTVTFAMWKEGSSWKISGI